MLEEEVSSSKSKNQAVAARKEKTIEKQGMRLSFITERRGALRSTRRRKNRERRDEGDAATMTSSTLTKAERRRK